MVNAPRPIRAIVRGGRRAARGPEHGELKSVLKKHCSDVSTCSLRSNACDVCLKFKNSELRVGTAEETESFGSHVNDAISVRGLYNQDIVKAGGTIT